MAPATASAAPSSRSVRAAKSPEVQEIKEDVDRRIKVALSIVDALAVRRLGTFADVANVGGRPAATLKELVCRRTAEMNESIERLTSSIDEIARSATSASELASGTQAQAEEGYAALRESIEANQLRLMKERGSDLTIFSPRASFMAHHIGDFEVSSTWAAICNELCFRVAQLFPDHFIPAAMLPQSPGVDPKTCISELVSSTATWRSTSTPIRRAATGRSRR